MPDDDIVHRYPLRVSFGDCDPAGIVFYPNIYRWMDTTFHDYLRGFGGHGALCARLDAIGVGLMESAARYRRPMRPGDAVEVILAGMDWAPRSVALRYQVRLAGALAVEASEVRGLFRATDDGLRAAEIAPLKQALSMAGVAPGR